VKLQFLEFSRGATLTKAILYKTKQRYSHRDTSEKVCLKKHGVSNYLGGGVTKYPNFENFGNLILYSLLVPVKVPKY